MGRWRRYTLGGEGRIVGKRISNAGRKGIGSPMVAQADRRKPARVAVATAHGESVKFSGAGISESGSVFPNT